MARAATQNVDTLDIEQRLEAAEDRLALLDLEGEYGFLYDSRQSGPWSELFTEDGIYQGRQLVGMAAQNLVEGRSNLADFCENEPLSGMHFLHVPHFTLAGDTAVGRVHFKFEGSGTNEYGRSQARSVSGYYDTAYVRTPAGWRIRRRITTYLESSQTTTYPYEPTPADLYQRPEHKASNAPYQDKRG